MIDKIISTEAQEDLVRITGQPVQVWESGRHIKQAASPLFSRSDLEAHRPPPGKFLSLSPTLGCQEKFGANRNSDDYPDAEIKKGHGSFMTNAKVYREHRNRDPKKAIGEIRAEKYSSDLGWGEVLFWTDIDKAASEFEAARKGEEQHTSMATSVSHDVCEGCGHISKFANDRCEHILLTPGAYLREFNKYAHMVNYGMKFKDQSWVGRPADRICHTREYLFSKAASAAPLRGDQLAEFYRGPEWIGELEDIHTFDTLPQDPILKAAAMHVMPRTYTEELDHETLMKMSGHAWPARVLRSLQKRAMLLPLQSFNTWISGEKANDDVVDETRQKMATIRAIIISRSQEEPDFAAGMGEAIDQFQPSGCGCEDILDVMMDKAREQFSCRYSLLAKRSSYSEPRITIADTAPPSPEAVALGALYNAYLIQQKRAHQSDPEVHDLDMILAHLR
jgi:hypothetical protein